MISYKEWKQLQQLQESMAFNLGLVSTPSLGIVGANTMTPEEALDEAKKKAKKMLAGSGDKPVPDDVVNDDDDDDDDDDETGDGEVVPPSSAKDVGEEEDDDDDDEEIGDKGPKFAKKKMKKEGVSEEEQAFFDNLRSQLSLPNTTPLHHFKAVSEEILLPVMDPNTGLVANDAVDSAQPQAGEPGFAPDTRIGAMGSFSSLEDFAGIHTESVKKK